MLKFEDFILEWKREYKKKKSNYFTKRISISKIELESICDKLNIDYSLLKFISSGSFGNAYKIGDKVLKITSDKREAKSVNDIIKLGGNDSIVRYYSINIYKNNYIILMDYLNPLEAYIKDDNLKKMIVDCLDIIYDNWNSLSIEELVEKISDKWVLNKYDFIYIDKVFNLYFNIKDLIRNPDIHIGNIGVDKEGRFLIFDFTELSSFIRKFDDPKIL